MHLQHLGPCLSIYGTIARYAHLGYLFTSFSNPCRFCCTFRDAGEIGGFGEAMDVELFLPGIASLVNHHAALDNGTRHEKSCQFDVGLSFLNIFLSLLLQQLSQAA